MPFFTEFSAKDSFDKEERMYQLKCRINIRKMQRSKPDFDRVQVL